jgi:hypothetical protein
MCSDVPEQRIVCYSYGSPQVGDQRWVAHFNDAVHESWRFGKSQDIVIENLPVLDLFFAHVKGTRSAFRIVLCRLSRSSAETKLSLSGDSSG